MRRPTVLLTTLVLLLTATGASAGVLRSLAEGRMRLPDSLKSEASELVALKYSFNRLGKKPFTIGEAKVIEFRPKWRKTTASGWSVGRDDFGVRRLSATQRYTFKMETPDATWNCGCAIIVGKSGYATNSVTIDREIDDLVECDLYDETTQQNWTLTLDTSVRAKIIRADVSSNGTLSDGTSDIAVGARFEIEGTSIQGELPSGFLFATGDEWNAAIETSHKGAFHIRSEVPARERAAITAASAALLLRTLMGNPALND